MIENKNTPEKFAKSDKLIAPKTRKNWDSVHSWTGSPGIFMPVKSWDLPKNASVTLRPLTQFETLPTVSPLKGHYIQRYEYFFCPYRNYIANLSNDNVNELNNVEELEFPLIGNDISKVEWPSNRIGKCNIVSHGHLFKYLGMPTLVQDCLAFPNSNISKLLSFFIGGGPIMVSSVDDRIEDMVALYTSRDLNDGFTSETFVEILFTSTTSSFFTDGVYGYTYNAVPFLAYIDIFMNFIANPSESYVYNIQTVSVEETHLNTSIVSTPYKVMQAIVPAVRHTGAHVLYDIPDENGVLSDYILDWTKLLPNDANLRTSCYLFNGFDITYKNAEGTFSYNPFMSYANVNAKSRIVNQVEDGTFYNHEGMFLVPYLPDYFTTWLDPDDIQFSRQIVSSDMSVQSLRLAERKWADFGRQIVNRSKRYTSWLETAFGVNGPTLNLSTKPIWVGRDDIMVNFQNITSNAETDKTSYTGSLGSNVSRADFKTQYNDVKPIRFTTQEPGLLMCVSYIVPEVSYGKGVDKFLLKRKIGDLYRVPYDAIGFQTTDSRELDAGCSNPGINIGYNISWAEYMTKVNTHVGLFNTTPFRSWLLSRETIESDTVPMPGVPTKPDKWYLQNSTYIDPDMFNHSFVNIGQGTDNFIIQTLFNFECKLPMSNQILNTRW